MQKFKNIRQKRNGAFLDRWSLVHVFSAFWLCLVLGPGWAFAITVLWEPLELFVISPFLARYRIVFGYETVRNSLSDIVFDAIGVGLGILVLPLL